VEGKAHRRPCLIHRNLEVCLWTPSNVHAREWSRNVGILSQRFGVWWRSSSASLRCRYTFGHGQRGPGYAMEETFETGGVACYFTGHEHVFQHHRARGIDHFVLGASGAQTVGFYQGEDRSRPPLDWIDRQRTNGFLAVEVTADRVVSRFVSNKGFVVKTVVTTKAGGDPGVPDPPVGWCPPQPPTHTKEIPTPPPPPT